MPDDDRTPASDVTAYQNSMDIARETGRTTTRGLDEVIGTSDRLRRSLRDAGLKGFRHGGRVKRDGIYRLHAGERVIPARHRRRGRR